MLELPKLSFYTVWRFKERQYNVSAVSIIYRSWNSKMHSANPSSILNVPLGHSHKCRVRTLQYCNISS